MNWSFAPQALCVTANTFPLHPGEHVNPIQLHAVLGGAAGLQPLLRTCGLRPGNGHHADRGPHLLCGRSVARQTQVDLQASGWVTPPPRQSDCVVLHSGSRDPMSPSCSSLCLQREWRTWDRSCATWCFLRLTPQRLSPSLPPKTLTEPCHQLQPIEIHFHSIYFCLLVCFSSFLFLLNEWWRSYVQQTELWLWMPVLKSVCHSLMRYLIWYLACQ